MSRSRSPIEYLYGTAPVLNALSYSGRLRKLSKLSLLQDLESSRNRNLEKYKIALQMATNRGIQIEYKSSNYLSKLVNDNPHQGLVLSASPIRLDELNSLGFVQDGTYDGMVTRKEYRSFEWDPDIRKKPLWIALEEIVDVGNLGAILRSCHFFRVDGVIMTQSNTCPVNASVSKTSAGALEIMRNIYATRNLASFLNKSRDSGWYIYGTDLKGSATNVDSLSNTFEKPTILVLGNEGHGIQPVVSKTCHEHLRITGNDRDSSENAAFDLDSLNVSVSAAIIIHKLIHCLKSGA